MKLIILLSLFFFSSFSFSINCSLPNLNRTENTICKTPYLLELDKGMNDYFSLTKENSLSIGFLKNKQNEFIKKRNECSSDIECIKKTYIINSTFLKNVSEFKSLDFYFHNEIDKPFDKVIKNESGFIIKDNPWSIKFLFNEKIINFHTQKKLNKLIIVGDLIIDNNIYIFITAQDKDNTYLISFNEKEKPTFEIIKIYDKSIYGYARSTKFIKKNTNNFIFELSDYANNSTPTFVTVTLTPENKIITEETKKIVNSNHELWIGFCDRIPCQSRATSNDAKYQVAEGGNATEGIYIFDNEKPRDGINVFLKDENIKHKINEGFTFYRNYAWGKNGVLFFDNSGGYACIWKTNLNKKTTERILPVEKLVKPYYIYYNNNDYIISKVDDADEYYISRHM